MGAVEGGAMGETDAPTEMRTEAEKGAVQHLKEALETNNATEKDFHIKHTLQLLDVNADSAD